MFGKKKFIKIHRNEMKKNNFFFHYVQKEIIEDF